MYFRIRYEVCPKKFHCKISWADETGNWPGTKKEVVLGTNSNLDLAKVSVIIERFVPLGFGFHEDLTIALDNAFREAKINYWKKHLLNNEGKLINE